MTEQVPNEACARRGGVCDCGDRPCAMDRLESQDPGRWEPPEPDYEAMKEAADERYRPDWDLRDDPLDPEIPR